MKKKYKGGKEKTLKKIKYGIKTIRKFAKKINFKFNSRTNKNKEEKREASIEQTKRK